MKHVLGHKCEWGNFFYNHLSGSLEGLRSLFDGAKAPNTRVLIVEADRSTAGFFSSSVVESVLQNAAPLGCRKCQSLALTSASCSQGKKIQLLVSV